MATEIPQTDTSIREVLSYTYLTKCFCSLNLKEKHVQLICSMRGGSPLSHALERAAQESDPAGWSLVKRRQDSHLLVSRLRRSISHSRLRRARFCSNVSLLTG